MDKLNELETLVAAIKEDATKFYVKGNKVAGVRVRKAMQEVKQLAQDIRVEITSKNKD